MKVETEPGREPSQESSHASDSSHEATASSEGFYSLGSDTDRSDSIRLKTIGDLVEAKGDAFFVDGSRYRGTWDALGMAGFGNFRMPHGIMSDSSSILPAIISILIFSDVVYEGQMLDGMQHGRGRLKWPGNQVIEGIWKRGDIKKWRYTFADGLVYQPDDWTYCRFPDRR